MLLVLLATVLAPELVAVLVLGEGGSRHLGGINVPATFSSTIRQALQDYKQQFREKGD
jgi:hypothetical protein